MNANDIRSLFIEKLAKEEFVTDKTGVKTIELIGAQFIADEESIFGKVNHEWAARELEWYKSLSRNVNDIPPPIPQIWKDVADKNGEILSNYGWCVFSYQNYRQFDKCVNELKENPNSRRAILIYTRPRVWVEYNQDGRSDFICTNSCQYFIRDNKLIALVAMRSNDVVFGYNNDRVWQVYCQKKMADELGIEVGDLIWGAGSLHVYERHFHLVK